MNSCFPNFGHVVKFAFAALGLLPRKRGACDGLTEQEKKRIQKQVERHRGRREAAPTARQDEPSIENQRIIFEWMKKVQYRM